jgi:hypothetical protein
LGANWGDPGKAQRQRIRRGSLWRFLFVQEVCVLVGQDRELTGDRALDAGAVVGGDNEVVGGTLQSSSSSSSFSAFLCDYVSKAIRIASKRLVEPARITASAQQSITRTTTTTRTIESYCQGSGSPSQSWAAASRAFALVTTVPLLKTISGTLFPRRILPITLASA